MLHQSEADDFLENHERLTNITQEHVDFSFPYNFKINAAINREKSIKL